MTKGKCCVYVIEWSESTAVQTRCIAVQLKRMETGDGMREPHSNGDHHTKSPRLSTVAETMAMVIHNEHVKVHSTNFSSKYAGQRWSS